MLDIEQGMMHIEGFCCRTTSLVLVGWAEGTPINVGNLTHI